MTIAFAPRSVASCAGRFDQKSVSPGEWSSVKSKRTTLPATLPAASYSAALPRPTYTTSPLRPPAGVGGTPAYDDACRTRPPTVTLALRNSQTSISTASSRTFRRPMARISAAK